MIFVASPLKITEDCVLDAMVFTADPSGSFYLSADPLHQATYFRIDNGGTSEVACAYVPDLKIPLKAGQSLYVAGGSCCIRLK